MCVWGKRGRGDRIKVLNMGTFKKSLSRQDYGSGKTLAENISNVICMVSLD